MDGSRVLLGRRLLIPQRTGQGMAQGLREFGAIVDEVGLITRVPVPSPALHDLAGDLSAGYYQWLALTSAFTVEALARLSHPLYTLIGPGLKVAAVGRATAAAVLASGARVDLLPSEGIGGSALAANWPPGPGRVAVPGAIDSAQALPRLLRDRGWEVDCVGVYRTSPVAALPATLVGAWRRGDYDALVVTSGSVAQAAASLLGTGVPVVAIGHPSAQAATRAGFRTVVIARTAATSDLVTALTVAVG
ncbi:MAG: uroporphyrinogen-III synthase [Propionicimonas sp.]